MGTLTRTGFLARTGAGLTALVFANPALGARKTIAVYRLDPCGVDGCLSCAACVSHDQESVFPTEKHADGNRAHIGCNCSIVQGQLDYGTYVALFGNPGRLHTYRADRRAARTKAILRNHAPVFA